MHRTRPCPGPLLLFPVYDSSNPGHEEFGHKMEFVQRDGSSGIRVNGSGPMTAMVRRNWAELEGLQEGEYDASVGAAGGVQVGGCLLLLRNASFAHVWSLMVGILGGEGAYTPICWHLCLL